METHTVLPTCIPHATKIDQAFGLRTAPVEPAWQPPSQGERIEESRVLELDLKVLEIPTIDSLRAAVMMQKRLRRGEPLGAQPRETDLPTGGHVGDLFERHDVIASRRGALSTHTPAAKRTTRPHRVGEAVISVMPLTPEDSGTDEATTTVEFPALSNQRPVTPVKHSSPGKHRRPKSHRRRGFMNLLRRNR